MIDDRSTTWRHFFQADVSFRPLDGPSARHQSIPAGGNDENAVVPVLLVATKRDLASSASWPGFVAINSPRIQNDELATAGFNAVHRFAVVPGHTNPKWFIPIGNDAVSAAALRFFSPYHPLARVKHSLLIALAHVGVIGWNRDQVLIAQRVPGPLELLLSESVSCQEYAIAISSGTPHTARKPTLALFDKNGRPMATAKLGNSTSTRRLVKHEAHVLEHLARNPTVFPRVPEMLTLGTADGTAVAVQSPVAGNLGARHLGVAHRRFLDALIQGPNRLILQSTLVMWLEHWLNSATPCDHHLQRVFNRCQRELKATMLPVTIVHGDFAPWNVRQAQGRLLVFDWEYAELDGIPLLDELHYELLAGILLNRWSSARVAQFLLRQQPAQARRNDLSLRETSAIQMLYLLHRIALRSSEGQPASDQLITTYRGAVVRLAGFHP